MRRVHRFGFVDGLSEAQKNAIVAASVMYEFEARRHRGRPYGTEEARIAAARHRELLAAFCVPLSRVFNQATGAFENRVAPLVRTARA